MAIEYQGSFVKVMLDAGRPTKTSSPMCRNARSFDDPFDIGDVALAAWATDHARLLA